MRLIGSVTLHVYETPVPGESARVEIQIKPLIHISGQGDFRRTAQAMREVAAQLDAQASPILMPPSLGSH